MNSYKTWLAGTLILFFVPQAFGQSEFSTFWKNFRAAVAGGEKVAVADMTNFPLSMPYSVKAVKNKQDFLRRYFQRGGERRQMFRERQTAKRIQAAV